MMSRLKMPAVLCACLLFFLTTNATAQKSIAGSYAVTKMDGSPIRPGQFVVVVVVPDVTPGNYIFYVLVDSGDGPRVVRNETAFVTPFWGGGFTFVNRAGNRGQLDLVGDGSGDIISTMTSGPYTGVQRLWTKL